MTTARTAPSDKALRRFRMVALWCPVALMVIIAAIQASIIPDLTATVATHFTGDGTADGWGPAWSYPVMTLGVGGGCSALFWGIGALSAKGIGTSGKPAQPRWLAAVSSGAAGFLGVALALASVQSLEGHNMYLWVGIAGAVVAVGAGWLGYRFTFDLEGTGEEPAQPRPAALGADERAVWTGRCSMARVGLWVHIVAVVVMVVSAAVVASAEILANGNLGWATWLTLVLAVLVSVGIPATTTVVVRVDHSGLTVASPAGLPRIHIPLERISTAEVTEVNPMGEFGGWGWRLGLGGGGWAVCLRAGEGIRITRTNGKPFTVTVDDAAMAVSLLEGLKARG
jgi:hypothetical protein